MASLMPDIFNPDLRIDLHSGGHLDSFLGGAKPIPECGDKPCAKCGKRHLGECKATRKPGPCKKSTGPKAAAKSTPPVHPFAGKSREEIIGAISHYSAHTPGATPDPWGLGDFDATPHAALQGAIVGAVQKQRAANSFKRLTVKELWDANKVAQPDLSLGDFQGTLVQMHKAGKIELGPYTQAPTDIPHPEFVIPFGFNRNYYVGPGRLTECKAMRQRGKPVQECKPARWGRQ